MISDLSLPVIDGVTYHSEGTLAVLGDASTVEIVLKNMPVSVRPWVWLTDVGCEGHAYGQQQEDKIVCSTITVTGHFGAFELSAFCEGRIIHRRADLILDLQMFPLLDYPVLPIGYFFVGKDSDTLSKALREIGDLVGTFDKPKFFEYQEEHCIHKTHPRAGCHACIDVCGTGAIRSVNENIEVNPYYCQGCGECTTVCPTDALRYAYPYRQESLAQLRQLLVGRLDAGYHTTEIVLYDSKEGAHWIAAHGSHLADRLLPYEVEAIGSVGIEWYLTAFTYGAHSITLLIAGDWPDPTQRTVSHHVNTTRALLKAMGYSEESIRCLQDRDFLSCIMHVTSAGITLSSQAELVENKRDMIRLAVEHLYEEAPCKPDYIPLQEGSLFGEIQVDVERCTLCLACVAVCPVHALHDGGELPKLFFIEADCVQCGVCRSTCPEKAISLVPRYLFSAEKAHKARLLTEGTLFQCIRCGKPFATVTLMERVSQHLQHHPYFQGAYRDRLYMCETCRVASHFQ